MNSDQDMRQAFGQAIFAEPHELLHRIAYLDWLADHEEEQARLFRETVVLLPLLSHEGFMTPSHGEELPSIEAIDRGHAAMLRSAASSPLAFDLSIVWLAGVRKRKTINRNASSYYLKHVVERHYRRGAWSGRVSSSYLTNGEFTAAAIASGFDYARHEPLLQRVVEGSRRVTRAIARSRELSIAKSTESGVKRGKYGPNRPAAGVGHEDKCRARGRRRQEARRPGALPRRRAGVDPGQACVRARPMAAVAAD